MSAGYTSGSWEVPTGFEQVDEEGHEGMPVFVGGNPFDTIATVWPREGCNANARLIAAAPDLLVALKGMLLVFGEDEQTYHTLRMAREAIEKATGKEMAA